MEANNRLIYTVGHSTRTIHEFVEILKSFALKVLVDVRNFPGSRRFPHFNKEALDGHLFSEDIRYVHLKSLGGRRKPLKNSINTRWRNAAFRGYADYMQTEEFTRSAAELEKLARESPLAYMCSEAVWWSCHRSLISDYLKMRGWKVMNIMGVRKADEHPYTSAARIVNGVLRYDEPGLFEG